MAVKKLIYKHRMSFAYSKWEIGMDPARLPEVSIETGDTKPIWSRPYRRSPSDRLVIETLINEMLEAGIIVPSESEWSSPVVLVKKKDATIRFCVDFRKLNKVTEKEHWPLPLIQDAFDSLSGSKYFTSLDLFSGYWQIPMAKDMMHKTAFVSHMGVYEYKVLPFGLTNAPSKFQKCMDSVLRKLSWKTCCVYLDDIVVFAPDFDTHMKRLDEVINCLAGAHLKLNPKKCFFASQQLDYLGHIITPEGIKCDPRKVEKIMNWPVPKNLKELRSFLGLAGYYRSFIDKFSIHAACLYALMRKNTRYRWTDQCQKAFEYLRTTLTKGPVRVHFDPSKKHWVVTDACKDGIGAVLHQEEMDKDGKATIHPVAYWGRGLNQHEKRYGATELEMMGVVNALTHFRPYLHGLPTFTVVTDHRALLAMLKEGGVANGSTLQNIRMNTWQMKLQGFRFKIEYTPGKGNFVADALSRMDQPPEPSPEPDEELMCFHKRIVTETACSKEVRALQTDQSDLMAQLMAGQLEDGFCKLKMEELHTASTSSTVFRKFCMHQGLLCRKTNFRGEEGIAYVVPRIMSHQIISAHHNPPEMAHQGQGRTIRRIRETFWWPRLKQDTIDFVRGCPTCTSKKPNRQQKPPPQRMVYELKRMGLRPFSLVGIDIIVMKDHESDGFKYIITGIDYLTKWIAAEAVRVQDTRAVINFIKRKFFYLHSPPRAIITDNGTQFKNIHFDKVLSECHVQHKYSAKYHPECNGQVERANGIIKEALSHYAKAGGKGWHKYLDPVVYGLNCAESASTGFSPFYALYGCGPRKTLDITVTGPEPLSLAQSIETPPQHEEKMRKIWETCWERCRRKVQELANRRDPRRIFPIYTEQDMVMVFNPSRMINTGGMGKGFVRPFDGPFVVLKVISPSTYVVAPPDDLAKKETVSVRYMKRWHPQATQPISFNIHGFHKKFQPPKNQKESSSTESQLTPSPQVLINPLPTTETTVEIDTSSPPVIQQIPSSTPEARAPDVTSLPPPLALQVNDPISSDDETDVYEDALDGSVTPPTADPGVTQTPAKDPLLNEQDYQEDLIVSNFFDDIPDMIPETLQPTTVELPVQETLEEEVTHPTTQEQRPHPMTTRSRTHGGVSTRLSKNKRQ